MEDEIKTFTQDEVNKIISDRLAKEAEKTAKKYGDYDDLKEKAGSYEQQIADLTAEHEKKVSELNATIHNYESSSVKMRIALEKGLPLDLAERLQGDDEAEIRADADKLLSYAKPTTPPGYNPEPTIETDPKRAELAKVLSGMKR